MPGRIFTLVASAVFVTIGVAMIVSGSSMGWLTTGFFGVCFVVALFERRFPRRSTPPSYRLVITGDEIACEHARRKREAIAWDDVIRIWYVTTSDGPRLPDEWLLFEGEHGGCSFPTEASGISDVWGELERRFPGFDFGPIIRGGTNDARHLCWDRQRMKFGA